jgi:hypothetical protein
VVLEVGHVPDRHPARLERLLVGADEPAGELADKARLALCDRDAVENLIAPILHGIAPGIGQELDTVGPELGR